MALNVSIYSAYGGDRVERKKERKIVDRRREENRYEILVCQCAYMLIGPERTRCRSCSLPLSSSAHVLVNLREYRTLMSSFPLPLSRRE